jgi:hypothetical protein
MLDLYLQHGRHSPEESPQDWGFDGPRLKGVKGIHQTYGNAINVFFVDRSTMLLAKALTGCDEWVSDALVMRWHGDLVHVNDESGPNYYGDWGLM